MAMRLTRRTVGLVSEPTTALEWTGAGNVRSMLFWDDVFPLYGNGTNGTGADGGHGVSGIFEVFPQQITRHASVAGDRYWTFIFHGNSDDNDSASPGQLFSWDGGVPNSYWGFHPYPQPSPNGTGSNWEISVASGDELGAAVVYDRWYKQAFRVWRQSSSITQHEYYYDLDLWVSSGGTQGRVTKQISDSGWADQPAPNPKITIGQAAWLDVPSNEEARVRMRNLGLFVSKVAVNSLIAEIATPGTVASPWYRKVNPKSDDVADDGGAGNHPQWRGTPAATWTA